MIVKWHLKYIICTKWSTHLSRPEIDNTLYWSNKAFSSMVSLKIYAFVWIYPLSLSWISLYIVIISCNASEIFWFMSNNNWTRLRIVFIPFMITTAIILMKKIGLILQWRFFHGNQNLYYICLRWFEMRKHISVTCIRNCL